MYNQRQKIQEILDSDYNTKEKIKISGEVFTPFELIEEMLDKLPEDVWYNPDKTWLDPAAGLGNFHVVVVERLMANGIPYKNIIENQLYFVELNPDSAKLIKKIFDPNDEYKMNLVCADTLNSEHDGWNEVGYMWDENDKEMRKNMKAKKEENEKNKEMVKDIPIKEMEHDGNENLDKAKEEEKKKDKKPIVRKQLDMVDE